MIKHTIAKSLCQKWWLCVFLAVVIIAVILLSLAPAYILQALVDNVLSVNAQPDALTHLPYYAIAYFLMLALVGLFDLIKQILLVIIGENLMKDIRLAMSKKLTSINALYFSKVDSSQTTSTFVNDVDTIAVIFTDGIISMAIDLLKIIGIIASMFVFSTMLGIIAIAIVPIIYIISHAFKNKMFRSQLKNRLLVGKVNNHITQTITTRQMIKVYALEQYMSDKYQRLLNQNYDSIEKVNFLGSIYSPIVKTFSAATIAIILIISGVNDSFFGITIGALAAAITLVESLFDPIDNLGMELQSLQSALSGIRRVNDFLTQPDDPAKKNITLQQIAPDGKVTLR
ncbi:MAG: ABC transporter transmembrane domain-containing protein, partial [Clostridia bacterium]